MNRTPFFQAAALLAAAATITALPGAAHAAGPATPGFRVVDGRLVDATGQDFVLRGVNHAHTWYADRTERALSDVKALGANSVRVVLGTGTRWTKNDAADVADVVARCKANRLICVLEAHDTTGYGEQGGAASLSEAVDYWLEVASALKGQEKYVIVNLGNEPYGNSGYAAWTQDTKNAIGRLRAAGLDHTLMVDAPNWGQDWSHTMRDNAPAVFASDPDRNTVFSVHMYGVYDTAAEVEEYLGSFVDRGLPVVVGEFGHDHSDGDPDEDAVMATARRLGLGYLGWSWSGNGGGVEYLDLAEGFDASRLTAWGERLFNGPDGIRPTSREAGVYGDGGHGNGCSVAYRLHSWGTGFNADVTVRNTGALPLKGWKLEFALPDGNTVNSSWNAVVTQDGRQVRATGRPWTEVVPAGGAVSFGLNATGPGAVPTAFSLDGVACAKE
ncbi:cellulase family glycosylhydrolase [Streptomyces sp. NPDC001744]|uniref:cellulase family glycosylhydrolase n=1 Tax=Streptomyces sp. NPDC001744 TaxID=3364606 RepID=UPI0036A1969F